MYGQLSSITAPSAVVSAFTRKLASLFEGAKSSKEPDWGAGNVSDHNVEPLGSLRHIQPPDTADLNWLKAALVESCLLSEPLYLFWSHPEVRRWLITHRADEQLASMVKEFGLIKASAPGIESLQYVEFNHVACQPFFRAFSDRDCLQGDLSKMVTTVAKTFLEPDLCNRCHEQICVELSYRINTEPAEPNTMAPIVWFARDALGNRCPGGPHLGLSDLGLWRFGQAYIGYKWGKAKRSPYAPNYRGLEDRCGKQTWAFFVFKRYLVNGEKYCCILPWNPRLVFMLSQVEMEALCWQPLLRQGD